MNKCKKIIMIVILALIMIGGFSVISNAETTYKPLKGEATNNVGAQDYNVWSDSVNSYLYENKDGTLTRVEYTYNSKPIIVETYDSSFNLKSTKKIELSLPIFGGFYSGSNYNFIVTGQRNTGENNNIPVYRIEKYSKNWQKLGTADLKNCNTTLPFRSGSCRMAESDGTLYIETSHQMYASKADGFNHQANLGIEVDINTMNITYSRSNVGFIDEGYVAHSFNQFIQAENGYSYAVNHSDGLGRGVVLVKRKKGKINSEDRVVTYVANGNINLNETGMSIGGFELSNNNCLIAGNSIDQDAANWNVNEAENIFVTITAKNNFTKNTKIWLTKYPKNSEIKVSTPHLVKINGNKFAVMWEENTNDNGGLVKIALIDENGKQIGKTISIGGRLSDCKPIVYRNNIIWYATVGEVTSTMFSLDISSDAAFTNSNGKNVISLKDKLSHFTYSIDDYGQITIKSFDNKIKNIDFTKMGIPNWVAIAYIDPNSFEKTDIESIVFPESLKEIRYRAFINCTKLKGTIRIPKNIYAIRDRAFFGCDNIEQVIFEKDISNIGEYAFYMSKSVEVGKTIRPIIGLGSMKKETSNKDVATISNDGTIKGVGEGYANISYSTGHGTKEAVISLYTISKLGDVNSDGKINTKDAREVLLAYIGKKTLTGPEKQAADVNKDGKINTKDARQILLYYIGKIKQF